MEWIGSDHRIYSKPLPWPTTCSYSKHVRISEAGRCRKLGFSLRGPCLAGSRTYTNVSSTLLAPLRAYRMLSYYFFRSPFIQDPPETPLPEPTTDPQWYGEVYIRYSPSQTLWPMHFGYLFKTISELRMIMNDIATQFFSDPQSQRTISIRKVLEFKSRLDDWFKSLPDPLQPQNIVLPCHLTVQ